ncbi:MAG: transglycosylase domain-containing protein [Parabacteroides sp.]|jgi:penicillin-binding protein 1A|nr:transglycosylase domain-containing protein [Parabacteroides sp.]MBP8758863.1 transglycosylase domain-containing protein [Parabacteroides sp.]MBP9480609.1 transglycosylase domain-containing protein [Parabacteroides sp.]MBP9578379.1 transglycosylase domain-containing protein [Parabacteroides sp.]MDD2415578.1 transglycosylase domain-containing protein [Parabacteroides sp.]
MINSNYKEWVSRGISAFNFIKTRCKAWVSKGKTIFKQSPWYKKLLLSGATFLVLFFIYLIMVDINFLWLFGKSPSLSSISNPNQSVASVIYSADGKPLGKYFRENRTPVEFDEISPILIKTLIATEDERFYEHFGVDLKGVFAAVKDMTQGRARGASTITQQLVKNMFKVRSQYSRGILGQIPGLRLLIAKSKEWISAVKIEMFYDKNEILTMYLNTVDFGSNAYGIKTACKTYFKTSPKNLTIEQSATLVGLLKATTTYNPRVNPKNSLKRRNVVLENLRNQHIITAAEFDSIKRIPIKLNYSVESNYDGQALYFREAVAQSLEKWCKDNEMDLYSDGLKIYTTLDTRMQKYAEEAVDTQMRVVQRNFENHWGRENPWRDENHEEIVGFVEDIAKKTPLYKYLVQKYSGQPDSVTYYLNEPRRLKVFDYKDGVKDTTFSCMDSIRYMERFMHTGFVAMEPQTGYVKAWVGDINFETWKYDKVISKRQPGSTFKLFVYATAIEKGLSPCDTRPDNYITWDVMEKGELVKWVPRNANGEYTGQNLTLKAAFARSINTIAVKLAQETGTEAIIKTAHAMGIKTPLNNIPSISLGSSDVSLLELVNSYCTVVNEGKTHDPVLVTRIEDHDGNVLYEYKPVQKQAITYETAFLMTQLLRAGLTEYNATSQNLWTYDIFRQNTEFGGKTGTSSNHSDAWFVGVSPNLVGGAWVGGEHRSIHFRTGKLGEGSKTALPIFGLFMEKVLADNNLSKYRAKFPKPTQPINKQYECMSPRPIENDSIDMLNSDSLFIEEEEPEYIDAEAPAL